MKQRRILTCKCLQLGEKTLAAKDLISVDFFHATKIDVKKALIYGEANILFANFDTVENASVIIEYI